jgi:hypothetical protein
VALALRATEAVRALLRSLASDSHGAVVYNALAERITLIRHDPGNRLARGVERQMEPSGVLARASLVFIPDTEQTWVIVWTAVADDEGEAIALHHIEPLGERP